MKRKMKWLWVLGLVCLLLGPGLLAEEGQTEIGVQAGIAIPDQDLSGEDWDISNSSWVAGIRGGYQFAENWGWFADLNFSPLDSSLIADDADTVFLRTGLERFLSPAARDWRWYVDGGLGLMGVDFGDESFNRSFASLGLGQRFQGDSSNVFRWELRGDRTLGNDGLGGEDLTTMMLTVGWGWASGGGGPSDLDGDGVIDRKDDCPNTPPGARVDAQGCPRDSDGDGVFDGLDKCPGTPQGWAVDSTGCALDSDGDGVVDGKDDCPNTPKGAKVDAKGCPSDSDGDGVYDGLDRCPATPKGAKVDAKGCPLDSDHDGVFDGLDRCPGTERGAKVDDKGCAKPKPKPMFEKESKTLVLEGVNFEHDSATLTPGSLAILDRVAASLKAWPQIRVEVGGHTDSQGSESYNLKLSTRRAAAVRDYLISKGIEASRLAATGYGESSPIADNATEAGRARNRRVELKRLN